MASSEERKMCRSWLLLSLCILVGLLPPTASGQTDSTEQQGASASAGTPDYSLRDLDAIAPASTDKHGLIWEGANYPGNGGALDEYKINQIKGTGVTWVMLSNEWFYSEPYAPTASCQSSQGPNCYCGPKAACHNYNFTALDQVVNALSGAGIQVGLRFLMHPTWAGGTDVRRLFAALRRNLKQPHDHVFK